MTALQLPQEEEALLRARAEALARPVEAASAEGEEVLVVRAGATRIGLRLETLVGAVRLGPVTRLPGGPPWLAGLALVRGRTRCVVDLALALELEPAPAPLALLVEQAGGLVAVAVAEMESVRRLAPGALSAPPAPLRPALAPYARGATADGVTLIELAPFVARLGTQTQE